MESQDQELASLMNCRTQLVEAESTIKILKEQLCFHGKILAVLVDTTALAIDRLTPKKD